MSGRMGTRADVVISAGALQAILASAEPIVDGGTAPIPGRLCSDRNGVFTRIAAVGPDTVGMLVVCPDGGTGQEIICADVPDGLVMVLDPYACEFSFYIRDENGVRHASVLMEE